MVYETHDTFHAGSSLSNPRRRGGINYAADSAEARWAAEAASKACPQEIFLREQHDREAEMGADLLRMMKMWSFKEAPAVFSGDGGRASGNHLLL
ncbi:unnamed protein product [Scytosiphon promiscuus]